MTPQDIFTSMLAEKMKSGADEAAVSQFQQVSLLTSLRNSIQERGHLKPGDFVTCILGKMSTSRIEDRIGLVVEVFDPITVRDAMQRSADPDDYHGADAADTYDIIVAFVMRDPDGAFIYQRWLADSALYRTIDPLQVEKPDE